MTLFVLPASQALLLVQTMSTLAEVESAVTALPAREKAEPLLLVAGQLRAEGAPLPEPRLFSPEQLQAWMDEDEGDMRKFRAGE